MLKDIVLDPALMGMFSMTPWSEASETGDSSETGDFISQKEELRLSRKRAYYRKYVRPIFILVPFTHIVLSNITSEREKARKRAQR